MLLHFYSGDYMSKITLQEIEKARFINDCMYGNVQSTVIKIGKDFSILSFGDVPIKEEPIEVIEEEPDVKKTVWNRKPRHCKKGDYKIKKPLCMR